MPHGNSKGSTPYKRQPQSTRDLLRAAAESDTPKAACRKVEKELGGIEKVASTSSLPRNIQQAATIRRQLFSSGNTSDPIMALVDLFKTELSGFIRSLQILPSPSCVLATDAQLQELIINCTKPDKFGVMHIDPTFNLGSFFVTPIVFPLVNYINRKSKGSPTMIGPVLIHHQMIQGTYSYFFNEIMSLKPEIRKVQAIGTDGEAALCNAIRDSFPTAVHLRCLKHVKDSIEHKLHELQFDKIGMLEIMYDIFGRSTDQLREIGLADAIDSNDFFAKLLSLEKKWNNLENLHRRYLGNEKHDFVFYDWFCRNYSAVFVDSIISSVRSKAGLGSPPIDFYNNRSESMNKLLKAHVEHQKSTLPQFVKQLHIFVNDHFDSIKKANASTGDWRHCEETRSITPSLSCSSTEISKFFEIDGSILKSIWSKASELVHKDGFITKIPGDHDGKGRMVASSSSSVPHMVTSGKKSNFNFVCDKSCPRYAAYGFCSHTIAVAEVNGSLDKFIEQLKKGKHKANLSSLAYHGLPAGAGEKGGKPKPKRRRLSAKDKIDLPTTDRLSKAATQLQHRLPPTVTVLQTLPLQSPASQAQLQSPPASQQQLPPSQSQLQSPASQPYYFKVLTNQIKVCAGCRLGYYNRVPPYDICVVHRESRDNESVNKAVYETPC